MNRPLMCVSSNGVRQSGLTLIEMTVVFLLVSLLATLLVQGVGYFLGQYEAVQRFQSRVTSELKSQHWFTQSVRAMIPYHQTSRQFRGEARSLRGISMQGLAAESGLPVEVSWAISEDEAGGLELNYKEEGMEVWPIAIPVGFLSFNYADSEMNWYDRWPPTETTRERIPHMVRVVDAQGAPIWLVKLSFFPTPVIDFRE